jgi:hypothetical protein
LDPEQYASQRPSERRELRWLNGPPLRGWLGDSGKPEGQSQRENDMLGRVVEKRMALGSLGAHKVQGSIKFSIRDQVPVNEILEI